VIINALTGRQPDPAGLREFSELTFLLQSGSDRIGALDFQTSATVYKPRRNNEAPLDELLAAAEFVEKGLPLTPALELAEQRSAARVRKPLSKTATKNTSPSFHRARTRRAS